MAKFCGNIGFVVTFERQPGVWVEEIREYRYYGDFIKVIQKWENGVGINDNLNISNTLSIIMDSFFHKNLGHIRYVKWMGSAWKVKNVEVQPPRVILTLGGLYNGINENDSSEDF